jgi:hypothetical protein
MELERKDKVAAEYVLKQRTAGAQEGTRTPTPCGAWT